MGRNVRKLSVAPVKRAQQVLAEDLSANAFRRGGAWRRNMTHSERPRPVNTVL
jgi:hypothetical protein